jgi:DNA-binding CsgD family transcriptional regulator
MEGAAAAVPGDFGGLSERELEVLKLVATGATNQQIARTLVISPNTVKVHLRNIYEKLGVQSRTEATMEAVRQGWVPVAGAAMEADGVAAAVESSPAVAPAEPTLLIPANKPIGLWQRVYMVATAVLVLLALWAPSWWQDRSRALSLTPVSDAGQRQVAPAPRPKVTRWVARSPLPTGRSRLALAAVNGKLYAIGGETASGVTGDVMIFDPSSNGWLPGTSKPTPVANAGAAVLDGRIYVPGGSTAEGKPTAVLEVYDLANGQWQTRAPLPLPLAAYADFTSMAGGTVSAMLPTRISTIARLTSG